MARETQPATSRYSNSNAQPNDIYKCMGQMREASPLMSQGFARMREVFGVGTSANKGGQQFYRISHRIALIDTAVHSVRSV